MSPTPPSPNSVSEMAVQDPSVEEQAAAEVGIVTDEETITTRSKAKAKEPGDADKDEDQTQQQQQQQQDADEDQIEEEKKDDKQDYSNWPLKGIREPHPNDCMFGRGGE